VLQFHVGNKITHALLAP